MLNFYFPELLHKLDLTEAAKLAIKRAFILNKLSDLQVQTGKIKIGDLQLNELLTPNPIFKSSKNNYISHILLKFSYFHDPNAFEWFLKLELQIFKFFLQREINSQGLTSLLSQLKDKISFTYDENTKSYILPFEKCSSLFSTYQVSIVDGNVVVSVEKMKNQLEKLFIQNLRSSDFLKLISKENLQKLSFLLKKLKTYNPNSSLFMDSLSNSNLSKYGKDKTIRLEDLPRLAQTVFPPCMYIPYTHLMKTGHLKHGGRLTLSLFLKEAGLKFEDAMIFWKTAFSKTITEDKFEKLYAYNIRYNYGREGKGTDFNSYGYPKLINMSANSDDICGCSFKYLDTKRLTQLLKSYGIDENTKPLDDEWVNDYLSYSTEAEEKGYRKRNGLSDILELVKKKQYQIAIGQSFNLRYKTNRIKGAIMSPIQYYFEAMNVLEENKIKKEEQEEGNN